MTTTNIIKSMGASDIDTKELTANLVAATKAPRQKLIDAEKTKADVAISNIALLKNGLSSLQQAATAIASSSKLRASQVTSSDSTVVRASQLSTTTAKTGDYSLEVDALAAPRRLKSTAMASGFTTSEEMRLTLGIPGVTVAAGSEDIVVGIGKSPAQIVTAINEWIKVNAAGSGVQASLLNTGAGAPLTIVVQGRSGVENAITLASDKPAQLGFTELTPAANARFKVNGLTIERPSNTVTDAIEGLSLDLRSITQNAMTVFVSNFLRKATGPKVKDDPVAGSLQNDSSARSIISRLRSTVMAEYTEKPSAVTRLSALGISFDRNGSLTLADESRFTKAFEEMPEDVIKLLSNDAPSPYISSGLKSGIAGDIAVISYQMASSARGTLPTIAKGYEDILARVTKKQADLDRYVERITANYENQFTALNSALAAFKSTSAQLEKSLNPSKD
ncbi:MAG: flagellar filament capping protein FliD [Proteobacteria bacterium]|nr:flagellar filament capping protein FliD [Pseudomonadota bacterium]